MSDLIRDDPAWVKRCRNRLDSSQRRRLAQAREHVEQRVAEAEANPYAGQVFTWNTCHGEPVCLACQDREGKAFTISQLRALMKLDFCFPSINRYEDEDQPCRCGIRPVCEDETLPAMFDDSGSIQEWSKLMARHLGRLREKELYRFPPEDGDGDFEQTSA